MSNSLFDVHVNGDALLVGRQIRAFRPWDHATSKVPRLNVNSQPGQEKVSIPLLVLKPI